MARFKLDLDPDPDVTVIGISSHVHDHRLCWALNRSMGLHLTRRRKDITEVNDGREAHFATFDQAYPPGEEDGPRLTLIHNHSGEGILLREQKQADFFLVVDNGLAGSRPDLLERVRRTEFVLAAFPLPFKQLRAGHKLLHQDL